MGKEGIIAEHPTLKLRYSDPDMAKTAVELKEKLTLEREEHRRRHEEAHKEESGENEITDSEPMLTNNSPHHHQSHIDHERTRI